MKEEPQQPQTPSTTAAQKADFLQPDFPKIEIDFRGLPWMSPVPEARRTIDVSDQEDPAHKGSGPIHGL